MKKHGLSSVIETVMLVAIVMVSAAIVFLWVSEFIPAPITLFESPVELSCPDLNFEAGVFDCPNCVLEINNPGNIPLYGINLKIISAGSVTPNEIIHEIESGNGASIPLDFEILTGDELRVVPIIAGVTDEGTKVPHTCDDIFGFRIIAE
jgi:hypothetical protein